MQVLTSALLGLLFITGTATADASSTSVTQVPEPTYTVSMTAYNATVAQTDGTPEITASGAFSDPDVVAARSQDLAGELPYGTVIEVASVPPSLSCGYQWVAPEIGFRVVADSMNAKEHDKIDILMPQKKTTEDGGAENPAIVLGLCKGVTIQVVGRIDIADMPTTQSALAASIDSSSELAVAK